MYISSLIIFIVLEVLAVAIIVAVLAVRLKIKKLSKTQAMPAQQPDTAIQYLSTLGDEHGDIASLRQQFYQQDLAYLQGQLSAEAFINQFANSNNSNSEISQQAAAKIAVLEEKLSFNEGKLADALQALQKMSRKEAEQIKPTPVGGEQIDQIYRLKCDKVDLQEKINALAMQLDQLIPDKKDQLTTLLIEQIDTLKAAAKQSDEVISLLEAKLEALTGNEGAASDDELLTPDSIPEQAPEDWQSFRSQLQRSLDALSAKIIDLQKSTNDQADESIDEATEARNLLSVFVQDSQEMMHCINELETENDMLKQQIGELQAMVDSGGNVEAASKIKALKAEIAELKAAQED